MRDKEETEPIFKPQFQPGFLYAGRERIADAERNKLHTAARYRVWIFQQGSKKVHICKKLVRTAIAAMKYAEAIILRYERMVAIRSKEVERVTAN
jgi:hypothetical protein